MGPSARSRPRMGVRSRPCTVDELGRPRRTRQRGVPEPRPVVWKDPRSCLLLPYWLAHLPKPVAAVFIWRSPLSVARSLQARDRLHLADGVALWERYNRSGLAGLVGVDTFVTRYESIVEDPWAGWATSPTGSGDLPQFAASRPSLGSRRLPLPAFRRSSSASRPPMPRNCCSTNSGGWSSIWSSSKVRTDH